MRKGDRVVVRTKDGEVTAKELKRRTAKSLELGAQPGPPRPGHPDKDVAWIARVMWARQ